MMAPSSGLGVFVTLDGPGGVGKSTVADLVCRLLRAHSAPVHATTEPSRTPLGKLAREGTESVKGLAYACLIAADRYHHLDAEVRPELVAGKVVVCDRYVASSLVLQRIDGVEPEAIRELNRRADRPDLSVILTGDPEVIARRLAARGAHSRYERIPGSSAREVELYAEAVEVLREAGFRTLVLDCTHAPPEVIAETIVGAVLELRTAAHAHTH